MKSLTDTIAAATTSPAEEAPLNMDIYWYCKGLASKLADYALGAPCEGGERFLARLTKRVEDIREVANGGWADPLWSVEPGASEVAVALGMDLFMAATSY